MAPNDFSFWWKGFRREAKNQEAVGEELAELVWNAAYREGRLKQRRIDVDLLHNDGNEMDVAHWLAEQPLARSEKDSAE